MQYSRESFPINQDFLLTESRLVEFYFTRYEIFSPKRWTHLCLSYAHEESFIIIVKDGASLNVNYRDPLLRNVKIDPDFLTKVFLGGCVFEKPGCSIPGGLITDLNIWGEALSAADMAEWTSCAESRRKGDLLDWDESEWELHNLVLEEWEESGDLCRPVRQGLVLLPQERNATSAAAICRKMRSRMAESDSEEVLDRQREMIKRFTGQNSVQRE